MKRIFAFLSLVLLTCAGAWAQTMPFEAAASADAPEAQMYYIYQPGSQEYVKVTNGNILGSTFTGDQFIFVTSDDANLFYVYNKSCGKFLTYTQTTDNGVSTKLTSQSVVKLVDSKSDAKTWRFVQEGSTDCYDIFPGEVANPNGNTASWNFRGGPDYALNFYKASDNNSSWQILGEIAGNMRCANKVFSLPGVPFMHKLLPNDGDEVLDVEGLPAGLELKTDRPGYKYIYGTAPAAGEYTYKVNLSGDKSVDVGFTVSPDLTQPTPFMGVLTWNAFQGNINDNNIKAIADAFETFGLKDLGYTYMCIDDQWASRNRTNGHLTWGTKFTDHAGVVDYVHNKGLKIGIYSDAGSATCSGAQPGSYGYEVTDAKDFLDWDFDLLKYDFCNATGGTSAAAAENAYKAMGDALKNAAAAKGKDFLFYMCEWGKRQPWEWGANTGATCWRATDDTRDYWSDTTYKGGVTQVLDIMKNIWAYQGVNRWNDADMLVVGLHGTGYSSNDGGGAGYSAGLTIDEARTNFALWCMFASPLTLSNNITNLDGKPNNLTGKNVTNTYYKEDLEIIRNKELIDLDQDPLGQAGEPIYDEADYIVFQKDMADGSIALSITNLSSAAKSISVKLADLSALKAGEQYKMRDLWKHAYLDTDATSGVHKAYTTADTYTVSVPKHATYVYRIQRFNAEDLTWTEPAEPIVPEPEPQPQPEATWIEEVPQTSTIESPVLYRIHNLGGDDGSYKGNDVYVQTQQSGIRFCDANGEADEFVFIDGGNSTVYIYDNTTSKYISWTTDAEGSCGWSGGKAVNVVTRVQAVDNQASAKTWAIVDDENTAGRYDIKPTASSNNSWSYYGGVDQESVVLNLESKTNRNCKWTFERKSVPTVSKLRLVFSGTTATGTTVTVTDENGTPIEGATATLVSVQKHDNGTLSNCELQTQNADLLTPKYDNDVNKGWELKFQLNGLQGQFDTANVDLHAMNVNGGYQNDSNIKYWDMTLSADDTALGTASRCDISNPIYQDGSTRHHEFTIDGESAVSYSNGSVLTLRVTKVEGGGCFCGVKYIELVGTYAAAEQPAYITTLDQLSNNKVYAIQSFDRGGWAAKSGSDNIWQTTGEAVTSGPTVTKNNEDADQQWAILKSDKGNYYLYNVGQKKFFVSTNYVSDTKATLAAEPNSSDFHLTDKLDVINVSWKTTNPEVRWALSMKYNTTDYFFGVTDWAGQQWKVFQNNGDYSKNTDRGMYFSIEPVGDFDATEAMAAINAFEHPCPVSSNKFYMLKSKAYGEDKTDMNGAHHTCGYMDAVTVAIGNNPRRTFDFNGYGSDEVTFGKVFQFRDADGDGNFNLFAEGGYMQKLQDGSILAVATATDATAADFTITETANDGYYYLIDANAPATANYRYAQLSDWWGFGIGGWNPGNADNDARCQWAFEEVETVTVPLTAIGTASYATLYAPYAVELPAGVKAYTAIFSADNTYLSATEVEGNLVPAGSAVILVSETAATSAELTLCNSDAVALTSDLQGIYRAASADTDKFVLSDNEGMVGFYKYTGTQLGANLVYVTLPAGSNGLALRFDPLTGFIGIEAQATAQPIYDLMGRRVTKAQNGLFIQNVKKVIK